jgi:hypothetical protein
MERSAAAFLRRGDRMSAAVPRQPSVPRWAVGIFRALSLLGLAGLLLTCVFGFETPNAALLATSVALMLIALLAVLWHLAETPTLTPEEKRLWIRELTGAGAFAALSEYLTSPDLRASARRRAQKN